MGVSKTVTVVCDYSGCKGPNNAPNVLQWCETEVESGRAEAPEASRYLVLFNFMGKLKSFCCQLHAAEFFLPPGYEAKQKQVVELPPKEGPKDVAPTTWMDSPLRSEGDPVEQADGCPDNGPEEIA